jgi:membrane protease YdiL (CAAX protease family)
MNNTAYTYKPKAFFLITFAVTWISWFAAAYLSYQPGGEAFYIPLLIPGLVAPFVVALWLILTSKSAELKRKFRDDLFNLKRINPASFLPMILLVPVTLIISIWISTLFGESMSQLQFAEGFSFSVGMVPVLLILILAAAFEELGWRSYAFDSLMNGSNLFKTTLIFSFLWAMWHFPLFFINGYYHNEIVRMNPLFGLNFLLSVIPMAFIITWLWKLNRGSILIAILFHFFINICQEALQITQATKCIETGVLFIFAAIIVVLNRKMFFEKPVEQGVE